MTFEAIRDLLIRESQKKPLVLAIEDLHWIDKTSEEFLDYLIGWLANARIMLFSSTGRNTPTHGEASPITPRSAWISSPPRPAPNW